VALRMRLNDNQFTIIRQSINQAGPAGVGVGLSPDGRLLAKLEVRQESSAGFGVEGKFPSSGPSTAPGALKKLINCGTLSLDLPDLARPILY
jgi:hypothetical protein